MCAFVEGEVKGSRPVVVRVIDIIHTARLSPRRDDVMFFHHLVEVAHAAHARSLAHFLFAIGDSSAVHICVRPTKRLNPLLDGDKTGAFVTLLVKDRGYVRLKCIAKNHG